MPEVAFSKYHALGNDFVIFFGSSEQLDAISKKITPFSNRFTGIGYDQCLLVSPVNSGAYFYRILNSDGSYATQCLNGARCIARYLHDKCHVKKDDCQLETESNPLSVRIVDPDCPSVILKVPGFQVEALDDIQGKSFFSVSAGNAHLIAKEDAPLSVPACVRLGEQVQQQYSAEVNVGFVYIKDKYHCQLVTVERGSGYTHCCASNALASVCLGIDQNWLASPVTVSYPLGALRFEWHQDDQRLEITGPATWVFDGVFRY